MTLMMFRAAEAGGQEVVWLARGATRARWTRGLEALHHALRADLPVLELALQEHGPLEDQALHGAKALAPVAPSKVVCIGLNYAQHAREMNKPLPTQPLMFLKPSTAVIGPEDTILLPAQSDEVHHEAELAVVIGRLARDVSPDQALDHVLGYTCANDVTARDIQRQEGQRYTRAKGFDTFCPLGPGLALAPGFDPMVSRVSARVNGQLRQDSPIDDLIFGIPSLISFVSHVMTLLPGDVLLTGTPSGVAALRPGDEVVVQIEGIGQLKNPVAPRSPR